MAKGLAIAAEPLPEWRVGDARDLGAIAADVAADLIFSCPPYWNLERYSDDPADLSTMDEASFFEAQAAIILECCRACPAMIYPHHGAGQEHDAGREQRSCIAIDRRRHRIEDSGCNRQSSGCSRGI